MTAITFYLNQQAVIHHHSPTGPLDDYNQPTEVETTEPAWTFLDPLSSAEDVFLRDSGRVSLRSFWEPWQTIVMTDTIEVDGKMYDVVGPPELFTHPLTDADHHLEVYLTEVT